jgi:hypothetical protein
MMNPFLGAEWKAEFVDYKLATLKLLPRCRAPQIWFGFARVMIPSSEV